MDNQEIFNALADIEEALYYREINPEGIAYGELATLHNLAAYMLRKWADLTGCRNQ